jgi:myosin-crossreactive antigen
MPKSSSMAPPEPAQGGTELNEYGELPTWKRLANRAKLLGNPKEFYDRTIESVWKTHGDVMEERLGDFRGREAMGDSLDKEHNTWNLYENWKHKEDLRKALHELGKNRYPINLENKGTEK